MTVFNDYITEDSPPSNPWLLHKRQSLVGEPNFVPASYLHLAYFWGYITEKEYVKGCKYSKLKVLIDLVQDNWIDWMHKMPQNRQSRPPISPEQEEKIEAIWRQLRQRLCPKDMIAMDWLVQEPLSYDWDKDVLVRHLRMIIRVLMKI